MNLFLLTFLFISQIFFIYLFNYLAIKINLLDFPDKRKTHKGNIPLIGGISIYVPVLLCLFFLQVPIEILIIYLTSSILLVIGLFDDKYNLGVLTRFFFQIIATLILIGFGIFINNLGNLFDLSSTYFSSLGIVFTFLCVVGLTNSINFVDGLDGLAGGLIINSFISIYFFSIFDDNFSNTNVAIVICLIFATSIFLFSNFGIILPKIFLGDSGSTVMGFLVAFLLIYYTQINKNFHPVLAIWAASIPTFDFFSVFIRRILKRINPFRPDKRHLHYMLIGLGYKSSSISIFIIIISMLLSAIGFLCYKYVGSFESLILYFIFLFIYIFLTIKLGRLSKKTL
tara:strand:- start:80 stop:1102 length:1023 start_codon:yes stop_codon:yes gene_type:complete